MFLKYQIKKDGLKFEHLSFKKCLMIVERSC